MTTIYKGTEKGKPVLVFSNHGELFCVMGEKGARWVQGTGMISDLTLVDICDPEKDTVLRGFSKDRLSSVLENSEILRRIRMSAADEAKYSSTWHTWRQDILDQLNDPEVRISHAEISPKTYGNPTPTPSPLDQLAQLILDGKMFLRADYEMDGRHPSNLQGYQVIIK